MIKIETTDWQAAPHTVETPLFAIGDIHGHAQLLQVLHEKVISLVNGHSEYSRLTHLGDYIDRGPDSIGALKKAFNFSHPLVGVQHLPGNHEHMFMRFLMTNDKFMGNIWLKNGGVRMVQEVCPAATIISRDIMIDIERTISKNIITKMQNMPTAILDQGYLFVHAGIPNDRKHFYDRKSMSINDILNFDWFNSDLDEEFSPLWVRNQFLNQKAVYENNTFVIHGHTPQEKGYPEVKSNRINLDTGSFFTGRATLLEIYKDKLRFHIAYHDDWKDNG